MKPALVSPVEIKVSANKINLIPEGLTVRSGYQNGEKNSHEHPGS
jgi:hypothetical protein